MGLASLYNVPTSDAELSEWSFAHAAQHHIENAAIYRVYGVSLPEYQLDPIDPNDAPSWAYRHQSAENNRNAVLGIAGYNLLGVDWNDPDSLAAFVEANATIHQLAAQILGL